jgi:16S rRNA processing protein RimM
MDCFNSKKIGYVKKSHGTKGECIIQFDFPLPTSFKLTKWVFLLYEGALIPFSVEWYQILDEQSIIIKFTQINSVDTIQRFVFSDFHVEKDMPWLLKVKPTFQNIQGYDVFMTNGKEIGIVDEVFPDKKNPLIQISRNGKQQLIPFQPVFIKKIDTKTKSIYIEFPESFQLEL